MSTATLRTREFTLRAQTDDDQRTVTGLAVPYDDEIELYDGMFESVAPGAFRAPDPSATAMKLLWRHDEPIGLITEAEDTDDGLTITARISRTTRGDEAYALLRDGVIDRFSIGFVSLAREETHDEDGSYHIRHTAIEVREVSLVPWPAYSAATVTDIRTAPTVTHLEDPMPTTTAPAAGASDAMIEVREALTDLKRDVDALRTLTTTPPAPVTDTRSAGEVLKAIAAGDTATIEQYNELVARAWSGTTTTDDPTAAKAAWVGDLTRIFELVDPVKALFSTGTLPAEGMSVEYAELASNSITIAEQAKEGDDLPMGKVSLALKNAAIKTFGGYTTLSRQAIERTRLNILNAHLDAMTKAAAKTSATYFNGVYANAVKERASAAITISKAADALRWGDLAAMVVDAAAAFSDQVLPLDGLIVDKATFKALAALTGSDGRPLMSVSGTGANTAGTLNLTGLAGTLVGVTVTPNLRQTTDALGAGVVGAFYTATAIRSYESSLVQLQDENIVNLTKSFSVYRYGGAAVEVPAGLVPLKIGA